MSCAASVVGFTSRVAPGVSPRPGRTASVPAGAVRCKFWRRKKSKRDQERKAAKRAEAKELNARFAAAKEDAGDDAGKDAASAAKSAPRLREHGCGDAEPHHLRLVQGENGG